jgi:hypothetical protein
MSVSILVTHLICMCFPFLESQKLHPSSLHHLVWLGLQAVPCSNKKNSSLKPGPDFHCQVFEGLQLTCNNLNCAGTETLNRLEIDAFLYAAGKIDFVVSFSNCYTDSLCWMYCVTTKSLIIGTWNQTGVS